ncbi:hypothetical protein [Roseibium sp.]|uniref:hypothetical protein n=1 Tax=Roseibium sp. TaxID=1936156 RepID=UPI003BAC4CD6
MMKRILKLAALLLFGAFCLVAGLWVPDTGWPFWMENKCRGAGDWYCFIYTWQTLISGGFALGAGLLAWIAIKTQTKASLKSPWDVRLVEIGKELGDFYSARTAMTNIQEALLPRARFFEEHADLSPEDFAELLPQLKDFDEGLIDPLEYFLEKFQGILHYRMRELLTNLRSDKSSRRGLITRIDHGPPENADAVAINKYRSKVTSLKAAVVSATLHNETLLEEYIEILDRAIEALHTEKMGIELRLNTL